MTAMQMGVLAMVFVVAVAAVLGLGALVRPDPARQRLRALTGDARRRGGGGERAMQVVAELTKPIGKLSMPEEGFEQSSLKLRFSHAGIRNPAAPAAFFGLKTLLTLGLPLAGFVLMSMSGEAPRGASLAMLLLVLASVGYYGPNIVLNKLVSTRQRDIFEAFPDALDLMTVCMEAGLGTEAAMLRVADDLQLKSPALADELRLVNLELRAGADRERALRNLAIRTGVEEVDGFVTMISQAERFGTSIAASLRIHAEMLRTRRRQRAEEAASKIALKLLFPLIFCIFPALMVVLMGPAMIQIYRVLLPTMGGN
ncbi:type II secretion system F family protein [Roseateles chitosanitabidus]|jgi:tight adherence protein C|uniref:type II secretion system F family protein n=1 Tax=Roseateles chitosanitabidus TaxID=65048 RepID=UPI000835B536|nr:type II secretion system F family protein [Roseateles chitosanitabidus]MBO9686278.1 type II secretion system F family protein [Roseateles chitosanitabidus]